MFKRIQWGFILFVTVLGASACAPTATPISVDSSPLPASNTITPSPSSTNTPPEPTPTVTPTSTPVPLQLDDLVVSGLDFLPIQSTLDGNTPTGHIFGWLENQGELPAAGVEVEFFYQAGDQKTSLGTDYANFVAAGGKNFISLRFNDRIPEGSTISAEPLSFYGEDPALTGVTLETRGEYRQEFGTEPIAFITGELYNPTNTSAIAREVYALWYNDQDELVHFSYVTMLPRDIPAGKARPYRIDLDFRYLPSDSNTPLADLTRYELISNAIPVLSLEEKVTFQSASRPYQTAGGPNVFIYGEGTNHTDEWLDVAAYWAGYDSAGRVVGVFESSFLGTIFAPGETRTIGANLGFVGGLRPDSEWIADVERGELFYSFSSASDPLLSLDSSDLKVEPQAQGYILTTTVTNNNSVEIGETQFYVRMSQPGGELVMGMQGRIAKGDMSDVIYAKPLAAGQSWPVTIYFELPGDITPDALEITFVARGK